MGWATRGARLTLARGASAAAGIKAAHRPPTFSKKWAAQGEVGGCFMQEGGSRRHMTQEKDKKTTFFGGLANSLGDALKFGTRQRRDWNTEPESKFYKPHHLGLSYPDLVGKIQKKLYTCLRLEAEAQAMSNHAEGADGSRKARSTHLFEAEGHLLGVRPSTIPGAGRGLFLLKGNIKTGEVITLYPGVVYTINNILDIASSESMSEFGAPSEPMLPMFLYKNAYLLSEKSVMYEDGLKSIDVMLDGNPYGQSALRYLKEVKSQISDKSWLELSHDIPSNEDEYREDLILGAEGVGKTVRRGLTHSELDGRSVLALGHMINHSSETDVRMIFVPLPKSFPPELLCLIPSVNAKSMKASRRWAIAVVALKDINADEGEDDDLGGGRREIFFDYGQNPKTLGWSGPKDAEGASE